MNIILISGRFSQYQSSKINRTFRAEEDKLSINQVNSDLLEIIDELTNKKELRNGNNFYWRYIVGFVLVSVIFIFMLKFSKQIAIGSTNTNHPINKNFNIPLNSQKDLDVIRSSKKEVTDGPEKVEENTAKGTSKDIHSLNNHNTDNISDSSNRVGNINIDSVSNIDLTVFNENTVFNINGYVLDEFNKPIPNVLIIGEDDKRVITDSIGGFKIPNPIFRKNASFYTLDIRKDGILHTKRVHINNTNSIKFNIQK